MRHFCIAMMFMSVSYNSYAQNLSCIDSIEHYIYSSSNFSSDDTWTPQIFDKDNNLIISGEISNDPPWAVIKANSQNQLRWFKTFPINLFPYLISLSSSSVNDKNEIILSGYARNILSSGPHYKGAIVKLDSNGIMIWKNIYSRSDNPYASCLFSQSIRGKDLDIIALTDRDDYGNSYSVSVLDSLGDIKWAKSYTNSTTPFFQRVSDPAITFDGTYIILSGCFAYETDHRNAFFICKINYENGNIVETRSFSFSKSAGNINPLKFQFINHINYDLVSRKYLVECVSLSENIATLVVIFDSIFTPLVIKEFTNTLGRPDQTVNVSSSNILTMGNPFHPDSSFLYTVIDDKLDILSQRKIKLGSYNLGNYNNYRGEVAQNRNDVLNFQISAAGTAINNKLLIFDASPFYNITSPCLGYDTTVYTIVALFLNPLNIMLDIATTLPLTKEPQLIDIGIDKTLSTQIICKEKSICDVIKIYGDSAHCLTNPLARFTLHKNVQCLRKTVWQIDTSAIKIIAEPNDTTVDVEFLKPYQGFIYAGFNGCKLVDSLKVSVYSPMPPVGLGKDTILCTGKTLTLHAGNGYMNYRWQDGTNNEFYYASQPGLYEVSVTDECGIYSSDTIIIKPLNIILQANYPATLCKYDTAKITLPANLNNYSFQPTLGANLINNILELFPSVTTLYTVTGEGLSGCTISDTVLIKVSRCPNKFYFPNAFTPNNDGLNDIFKPTVDGNPKFYDLSIYGRWGELVFESKNVQHGWNGYYKGSQLTGVYIWICKYQFINEQFGTIKGNVVLIK